MLSNNLCIVTLSCSSGPCHLSQFQIWIRVYLCNISRVQSLSCVLLFVTRCTVARHGSLSIINSGSLVKLKSTELVMASNHLILCHPLLLLPSIFPSIRVFSNESVLPIRWPKYWSFSFSISNTIRAAPYLLSGLPVPSQREASLLGEVEAEVTWKLRKEGTQIPGLSR